MNDSWYIKKNFKISGPYTESDIKKFISLDKIKDVDLLSNDDKKTWIIASKFGEIKHKDNESAFQKLTKNMTFDKFLLAAVCLLTIGTFLSMIFTIIFPKKTENEKVKEYSKGNFSIDVSGVNISSDQKSIYKNKSRKNEPEQSYNNDLIARKNEQIEIEKEEKAKIRSIQLLEKKQEIDQQKKKNALIAEENTKVKKKVEEKKKATADIANLKNLLTTNSQLDQQVAINNNSIQQGRNTLKAVPPPPLSLRNQINQNIKILLDKNMEMKQIFEKNTKEIELLKAKYPLLEDTEILKYRIPNGYDEDGLPTNDNGFGSMPGGGRGFLGGPGGP
jgi:hypothetical protein